MILQMHQQSLSHKPPDSFHLEPSAALLGLCHCCLGADYESPLRTQPAVAIKCGGCSSEEQLWEASHLLLLFLLLRPRAVCEAAGWRSEGKDPTHKDRITSDTYMLGFFFFIKSTLSK